MMFGGKKDFKNQNWFNVFANAAEGCWYGLTTQRIFKIHFFFSLIVLGLGLWLEVSFERFLLLMMAIIFGFTVEMANTAFEKTVDLVTEKYNPKAKIAKDLAAGTMLMASIGLAVLGFLILLPPLFEKLFGF